MTTVRVRAPKIWPNSNGGFIPFAVRYGCTPFVANVLVIIVSSQGHCISLFWLSLGVALDLGRVVSFVPSLGTPLGYNRFFSNARSIYYVPQLKPDKIFERICLFF